MIWVAIGAIILALFARVIWEWLRYEQIENCRSNHRGTYIDDDGDIRCQECHRNWS